MAGQETFSGCGYESFMVDRYPFFWSGNPVASEFPRALDAPYYFLLMVESLVHFISLETSETILPGKFRTALTDGLVDEY